MASSVVSRCLLCGLRSAALLHSASTRGPSMHIRVAGGGDSTMIARLHATSWQHAYRGILGDEYLERRVFAERGEVWRERFLVPKAGQHVIVAEDQGEIVGFACAFGDEDDRWGTMLDNLHTHPSHRGKGIGTMLIAEVASWSAENYPGKGLFLWVFDQNAAARQFYESLGGKPVGEMTWIAPDGSAVRELRYAWDGLDALIWLAKKERLPKC